MSSANPKVRLYAEIDYLLNELAEHGTKNGDDFPQKFPSKFKQPLQDLFLEDNIRDAQFHEERFWLLKRKKGIGLEKKEGRWKRLGSTYAFDKT